MSSTSRQTIARTPKLIDTDFPFAHLSLVAERESWRKEVYRPVYYLHKWWARRLGSVFRGIVLSACLDDSEDFWNRFYGSNTFNDTVLFDPFMGSGVTIGEAIKLGCRPIGRDINPVAYIACRAAFSQYKATDVLSTYRHLKNTLAPKLLSYFQTTTISGEEATVLYYFLVKVVGCPECGENIDLFKTRIFSKNAVPQKDPSARALCPACGAISFTLEDGHLLSALNLAEAQISSLREAGIKVSLGDAKVILMGQFLCKAHTVRNLDLEEKFLEELELDIDTYVGQVISAQGEILYTEAKPVQLALFEEMGKYLADKHEQPKVDDHS